MKIKLRTLMAGPAGVFQAGTVIELPEAQARDMVRLGYAEVVTPLTGASAGEVEKTKAQVERAVVGPAERAVSVFPPEVKDNRPVVNKTTGKK